MFKAVALVGFKKTGKTTLLVDLARELSARGFSVAAVKFTHSGLDLDGTDTARFTQECVSVAGMGENHASIYWNKTRSLQDMLPLLQADIVLVEGGKKLSWLPRILVLGADEPEDDLDNGLALASWGTGTVGAVPRVTSLSELADLVVVRSFTLPGLDCGACGRESCHELAMEIVAGLAQPKLCAAMDAKLRVMVGGQRLALNPFVDRLVTSTLRGLLTELKGNVPGQRVEIFLE